MTNVLEIKFGGQGSEKQVAWASEIFNSKMNTLKAEYAAAIDRVSRGNMPESYKSAWDSVFSDARAVAFVSKVAGSQAKDVIETKGNIDNKCFAVVIGKIVEFEYSKK